MLTHFQNGSPHMVDVSDKLVSPRRAIAESLVLLPKAALEALESNPKGDPIAVAELAGIMAAKQTSNLIPLCHPLPLNKVSVVSERVKAARAFALQDSLLGPNDELTAGDLKDVWATKEFLTDSGYPEAVRFNAVCKVNAKTGVEMEALTAASVAALTLYDMLKSASKGIVITGVRLLAKQGGRSGTWHASQGH
ncbi:MAG: cyclic pyranopterin monophosphate synthase MoaC [Deinococcota bacterium]